MKRFILVTLTLLLVFGASSAIEVKTQLINAAIGEDFSVNVYVYHPIRAPKEAYEKAMYEESQYYRFPAFYRGDLSELEYSELNNISSIYDPVTLTTSCGDDLSVTVLETSDNVTYYNCDIVEIDSTHYKVTLDGHLDADAVAQQFESINFMISSSILPEHFIEYEAKLIAANLHSSAEITGEPLDDLDLFGKCCVECEEVLYKCVNVGPSGLVDIQLPPGDYIVRVIIEAHCGNFTSIRDLIEIHNTGFRTWTKERLGIHDYYPLASLQYLMLGSSGISYYGFSGLGGFKTTLMIYWTNCDPVSELNSFMNIPGDNWTNDVPSFGLGSTDNSSLEFKQIYDTSADQNVTFNSSFHSRLFPASLSTDGNYPSKVTIHCPTDTDWRQDFADASLLVYPLFCETYANETPQLAISCLQADSSDTYVFDLDPAQPTLPLEKFFGFITPVNDEFSVSLELITGKSITFDEVVLISDSTVIEESYYDLEPQDLYVSSPRTVGTPITFKSRILQLSAGTLENIEAKLWIEDENGMNVCDTMLVEENQQLLSLCSDSTFHYIIPDQFWTPSTAGFYKAAIALNAEQNGWADNDTFRTDIFEVLPEGIFAYPPAIVDTTQFWGNPSSIAMLYGSAFTLANDDTLTLRKVVTEWEKPGTAVLHVKALVNGLPAQDLITPINITVGQSTEYPIKLETILPSDPDLDELTEFWVEVASPTDGARLSMTNRGSDWSRHYRRIGGASWYRMNGDWRITPIGYNDISSISGSQSGVLTKAGGPYLVTGNLSVAEFDTLIIEAGTTILYDGFYKFAIDGTLKIQGTATDPVYMGTSIGTTQWEGLAYSSSSVGNSVRDLILENADTGLYSLKAKFVSFTNNNFTNCDLAFSFTNSTANVKDSHFDNNGQGGYSYAGDVNFTDCTFNDNDSYGLFLDNVYQNKLLSCEIINNGHVENSQQPGLLLYTSVPKMDACIIKDNATNGIKMVNSSEPIMNTDFGRSGTNSIFNNGQNAVYIDPKEGVSVADSLGHAELYLTGKSRPVIMDGHNDVYDDLNGILVYWDKEATEPKLKIYGNYYYTPEYTNQNGWFILSSSITYSPIDANKNNSTVSSTDTTMIEFYEALAYEMEEEYDEARLIYMDLVSTWTDSSVAQLALSRILSCSQHSLDDLNTVATWYQSIVNDNYPHEIREKANNLYLKTLVMQAMYEVPMLAYVNRINNPVSELDSLFAIIDSNRVAIDATQSVFKNLVGTSLQQAHLSNVKEKQARYLTVTNEIFKQITSASSNRRHSNLFTLPTEYELLPAYPNPFNPDINIPFTLPEIANVKIRVYNILGQEVVTLVNKQMIAGKHKILWNGRSFSDQLVASGIYFVRMEAGNYISTQKIVMLK